MVPFDQIFDAVKTGAPICGLIIHEGQLTYAQAGFARSSISANGGKRNAACRFRSAATFCAKTFRAGVQRDLTQIMRESIDYGLAHREAAVQHSMPYARDMDADLAGKFIGMYVNDYTRDYGETGRAAIRRISRPSGGDAAISTGAVELGIRRVRRTIFRLVVFLLVGLFASIT